MSGEGGVRRRYTPEYQKEIDALRSGVVEEEEAPVVEEKEEDKALRFAKEIEMEAKGETPVVEEKEKEKEEKEEEEEEKEEEEEEKKEGSEDELELSEEKQRQLALTSHHTRRLYERLEKQAVRKEKRIATLKKKAKKAGEEGLKKL